MRVASDYQVSIGNDVSLISVVLVPSALWTLLFHEAVCAAHRACSELCSRSYKFASEQGSASAICVYQEQVSLQVTIQVTMPSSEQFLKKLALPGLSLAAPPHRPPARWESGSRFFDWMEVMLRFVASDEVSVASRGRHEIFTPGVDIKFNLTEAWLYCVCRRSVHRLGGRVRRQPVSLCAAQPGRLRGAAAAQHRRPQVGFRV